MQIEDIERMTKTYADARDVLAARVQVLEDELETIKRRKLRGIKQAVRDANDASDRLRTAIESSQHLFKKPRTLTISGIKVGFQKGKGKILFEDADQVVRLIRKHLPDQFETLVSVKETPVKKVLQDLSAAELKRIGVQLEETGDQVIIKSTDSQVDKLVSALLKEAEKMEGFEAA